MAVIEVLPYNDIRMTPRMVITQRLRLHGLRMTAVQVSFLNDGYSMIVIQGQYTIMRLWVRNLGHSMAVVGMESFNDS